ncbi:MAG: hypothetical protein V3S60_09895 [Acidimicrobiia bacterium]
MKPVGILYEHPEWFKPLFAELERRGVPYRRILLEDLAFDPAERSTNYSLVVNRMSPSAWLRGKEQAASQTLHYLAYLDEIGTPVLNSHEAFSVEVSKARQLGLLSRLGIAHPRARVITHPSQASVAAQGLQFPVLVKPNLGGSGAGIQSFEGPAQLAGAARAGTIELGPDRTALVQEHLPAEGDAIVRVEILNGEFLYAIRLQLLPGSFNLCPADYCELPGIADGVSGRGLPIEAYDPPAEAIQDAKRILTAAHMDLGGVEYLVNARDGLRYFYDVNALSNFVADAPNIVGFDPFEDLVALIIERARARRVA